MDGWIAYAVGQRDGHPLIHCYGRYIWLNERHLDWAENWFTHRGKITVFVARLLPAFRTSISLPAVLLLVVVLWFWLSRRRSRR